MKTGETLNRKPDAAIAVESDTAPEVANFIMRLIYSYMLNSWSVDDVRVFFSNQPLEINGRKLSETEFFEHLWNIEKTTPLKYIVDMSEKLEIWLVKNNGTLEEFFSDNSYVSILMEPKTTLWLISHLLPDFLNEPDFGTAILKFFPAIAHYVNTHATMILERLETLDNGDINARYVFTFDRYFKHGVVTNEWIHHCFYLKQFPLRFGMQQYKDCRILVEAASAQRIMDGYKKISLHNGIFYIEKERYGYLTPFRQHFNELGITTGSLDPPETQIVIIEKDYYCPLRKRTVLRKGVAYGSPVGVFEIQHTPTRTDTPLKITQIVSAAFSSPNPVMEKIEEKHRQVLLAANQPIAIKYHKSDSTLIINGKVIAGGTQGKLMYEILRIAILEKRTAFHRREFSRLPEFMINKYNSGLSVRLSRALQILQEFSPFIMVEKSAPGIFRIEINAVCNLVEQE